MPATSNDPGSATVYRPRGSQILAAALIALCAVGLASLAFTRGGPSWSMASLLVLIGYVAWWLLWFPCVRIDDEEVRLVNPLSTVRISWHSVIHVEARFAATITTPHGRFAAWAAPAPGMVTAMSEARRRRGEAGETGRGGREVPVGELPGTASGNVAQHVREVMEQRAESGDHDPALTESLRSTRHVHVLLLSVLVVLIGSTVLTATRG